MNRFRVLLWAALASLSAPLAAQASFATGNANADGWTKVGNSLAAPNYVQGTASYNFDMYSTSTSWSSSDYGWLAGDTVVGVGGVFVGANPNLTTSGGPPSLPLNSTSTRVVAKLGTSSSIFSADSEPGPANGSFSAGHGGLGSLLIGVDDYVMYAGGAGTAIAPSLLQQYTGSVTTIANPGLYSQLIYTWNTGTNRLASFEYLVNLSALSRAGLNSLPTPGNEFILTAQRGGGVVTDAVAQSVANADVPDVPEPASMTLLASGFSLMAVARRRRNSAAKS